MKPWNDLGWKDFIAHLVRPAMSRATFHQPRLPQALSNLTAGGQGSSRGDTGALLWVGWESSGGKSTESRSGKCERAQSSSCGTRWGKFLIWWLGAPRWAPSGHLEAASALLRRVFPSLALGKCAERITCFYKIFIQKQKIASVPRPLWSCHLARSSPQQLGARGHRSRVPVPSLPLAIVPHCRRGCRRRCRGDVRDPTGWVGGFAVVPTAGRAKAVLQAGEGIFFFFFSPSKKDGGDQSPPLPAVPVPAPQFL